MNIDGQMVKSAVNRVRAAISRRTKQARIAEEETQQRAADDQVIADAQKQLSLTSREHGMLDDEIRELERDNFLAEQQIAALQTGVDRQKARLEQCQADIVPVKQKLAELRELLNGVE